MSSIDSLIEELKHLVLGKREFQRHGTSVVIALYGNRAVWRSQKKVLLKKIFWFRRNHESEKEQNQESEIYFNYLYLWLTFFQDHLLLFSWLS